MLQRVAPPLPAHEAFPPSPAPDDFAPPIFIGGAGRSGTTLLRVMLEGKDQDEIKAWAQEIIDVVSREIG